MSPYFAVHEPTNDIGNPVIQLYVLPTGEDPKTKQADAKGIGGAIDDHSNAQITEVLTADNSGLSLGGPLGRLSFSRRVEKGDDGDGTKAPVAPPAPAGKGEILVDTGAVGDTTFCFTSSSALRAPRRLNGDSLDKTLPEIFNGAIDGINTRFSIFPTTAGSHQVSVVANKGGVQPKCAQLTAKQGTVSVDVAAGQQVEAYVYGTSATDLHLALAPIQPRTRGIERDASGRVSVGPYGPVSRPPRRKGSRCAAAARPARSRWLTPLECASCRAHSWS